MKKIETMEKWNILAAALHEKGYRLWQMQYSWDDKEGFHGWFLHAEKLDVEVITHNGDVERAIVAFNKLVDI